MSTEINHPPAQEVTGNALRGAEYDVVRELYARFGTEICHFQRTRDGVPTVWVPKGKIVEVLRFLKQLPQPFSMLYDLSAIDEQLRNYRRGQPAADLTVFYHLLALERTTSS